MNLVTVFLLLPTLVLSRSAFPRSRPQSRGCQKSGIQCIEKSVFVYCTKYSHHRILQKDLLNCPEGYICQEESSFPCIRDPGYTTITPDDCRQPSTTTTKSQEISGITPTSEEEIGSGSEQITTEQSREIILEEEEVDVQTTLENNDSGSDEEDNMQTNTEPFWSSNSVPVKDLTIEESDGQTTIENNVSGSEDEDNIYTNTEPFWSSTAVPAADLTTGDEQTAIEQEEDLILTVRSIPTFVGMVPICNNYDLFPGPNCNEYYECESLWLFWYSPVLKKCNQGDSFSIEWSNCVPSSESECID